jgi:hypothetical protein
MKPQPLLIAAALGLLLGATGARSLDLAPGGYGLSIGNSRRLTGLRINGVDRDVERITGVNLTLWNPKKNPRAAYNGATLGLIGTKARQINGLALSGIGVNARERITGIAAGGLGVGTRRLDGVAAGLGLVDVEERIRGIVLAGVWVGGCHRLEGLAFSPVGAIADTVKGVTIGGLVSGGSERLTGAALSLGFAFSGGVRGLVIGGLAAGGKELQGIVVGGVLVASEQVDGILFSLGGAGVAKRIRGLAVCGLGVGAGEQIRGVAIGSAVVFAKDVKGVTAGAFNGFIIDRIDLEDFLHFKYINDRFTGLSIGLVNYTRQLRGVQLGLINYAENNPRWLRLLPLVNVHL